ncbi:hypothetical protein GOP47_0026858 [Adiantum capillus-veneris]|nr:hypothetical protein GOP47_0026858 [Adiantum capillus-veneris]
MASTCGRMQCSVGFDWLLSSGNLPAFSPYDIYKLLFWFDMIPSLGIPSDSCGSGLWLPLWCRWSHSQVMEGVFGNFGKFKGSKLLVAKDREGSIRYFAREHSEDEAQKIGKTFGSFCGGGKNA